MPASVNTAGPDLFGYEISEISISETSVITARIVVESNSLWFDGHFPDNPIVPGIAQMSMIFDLMQRTMGDGLKLKGFKRVRFKRLIRPDVPVSVLIKPVVRTPDRFEYKLICDPDGLVCTGFIDILRTADGLGEWNIAGE